jgi:hypothetical protein
VTSQGDVLTLSEALRTGRIDDFVAQEEARGVGPADVARLDALLRAASKSQRSKDRTSRSPSGDDSTGN